MSSKQRNDVRVVHVDASQRATLRHQTLEILELEHHRFDAFADRTPAEQMAAAEIFRDAFDVLDATGWDAGDSESPGDVPLTAGHVELLKARRCDLVLAIADRLVERDQLPAPAEIAALHTANLLDRAVIRDLAEVIARFHGAERPSL
ncbi:MAG TPA: hypothetical protein VFG42_02370 [Baekduia sp.]|uniref:hypothetical protein n=1 Tax=Baekduia sp. TaxID=2600305 RepID=UPI002D78639D|nr:hypothetical protein [Baekduia sp.]HET6505611.1 hypothetical protein [Baekduia sp.]